MQKKIITRQASTVSRTHPNSVLPRNRPKSKATGFWVTLLVLMAVGAGGVFWFFDLKPGGEKAIRAEKVTEKKTGAAEQNTQDARAVEAMLPATISRMAPQEVADARDWNLQGTATVSASQFGGTGGGSEEIIDMVARGDGRLVMIGRLSARDGIPPSEITHALVDKADGDSYAFVAEFSADGQKCLWFSVFGGDIINPTCLALGPDGSIAIGGGVERRTAQVAGSDGGNFTKGKSVALKVSADGARVEWIRAGPSNQDTMSDIAVDTQGRVLYLSGTTVPGAAAYVIRRNSDGSESYFPGQPKGREWSIDFDVRSGLFVEEGQVGAYYQKGVGGEGFDYDGPGKWGPVRFMLKGIRQNGHIVLMPNDDIVVCGTLQYDFREGKNKKFPAFDTIVARFRSDGSLIWSSNLYQPNDSVHTPDQKDADLLYNPVNGDLYVLVGQHGSNVYRFKGELNGDTGNLFVYWLGQVNAETGELKEGWYWHNSRNTGYNEKGIPTSPPYPKLSGNRGAAIDVDRLGNIYMAGVAGPKAFTTANAWQHWPDDQEAGGNAALTVLSPNLDRMLYASMIKGPEPGKISANTLVVTPQGVWVGGSSASADFPSNPAPWSAETLAGEQDAALIHFKFN